MDEDLKTIIDWELKKNVNTPDGWALHIPDDYKAILFRQISEVTRYLDTAGYVVTTNQPDEGAWHGWNIPTMRANEGFPKEYLSGKNRGLYQLFHATEDNIRVVLSKKQGA